jgi:hypothetical protein
MYKGVATIKTEYTVSADDVDQAHDFIVDAVDEDFDTPEFVTVTDIIEVS